MNSPNIAIDISANSYETYFAAVTNAMTFIPVITREGFGPPSASIRPIRAITSCATFHGSGSSYSGSNITGLAGSWECLIAYDSLVFGLILHKILRDRIRKLPAIGPDRLPLRSLLLRDVTRIALMLNMANTVTFYLPQLTFT
ncbi:hypothetical protein CVT25_007625 [Psilocybe cyanescens]|uniref:Uncharacterized protein n=1 Tax=Psilocybe cyanescens TaxID=93625 RepID=A0A409X1B6_PSICY|nr:hypothetical protein CVT25_007625 [Psilocybe cyanescens]